MKNNGFRFTYGVLSGILKNTKLNSDNASRNIQNLFSARLYQPRNIFQVLQAFSRPRPAAERGLKMACYITFSKQLWFNGIFRKKTINLIKLLSQYFCI